MPAAVQYSVLLTFHFLSRSRWDEGPESNAVSTTRPYSTSPFVLRGIGFQRSGNPSKRQSSAGELWKRRSHFQASVCGESAEINQADSTSLKRISGEIALFVDEMKSFLKKKKKKNLYIDENHFQMRVHRNLEAY